MVVEFALTNTGPNTCVLKGFPGIGLLDQAGNEIPLQVGRDPNLGTSGGPDPQPVAVAPGKAAYFLFQFPSSSPDGSSPCQSAATVTIIPPDETHRLTVPAGNVQKCGDEGFAVGPVKPSQGL
jgi:hypothetical protein